jgi:hypothetical protein
MEYSNGRCCTKSSYVDDLTTMDTSNADEDDAHGFYICDEDAAPLCSVQCTVETTGSSDIIKVHHDTVSGHSTHRCYKQGTDCVCVCA